ncbi:cytochrome P450 3A5 [Pestalotiopsis sp. NC0098]|nr:cytochrome P450 3A5 [Pestalotiopsis sp. NC0098]
MDVVVCAGLAALESFALSTLGQVVEANIIVALFLFQYVLLKYYRIFLYHRYFSPYRHLPGPTDNHPLLGQSINFIKASSPTELYVKWMKQWPDAPVIRYLTFLNTEVLVCNSLNSYKDVLQTQCYSFKKPDTWRKVTGAITGKGVLVLEFEEHRAHRKMLAGPFSVPSTRKLEPVFQEKAKEVTELFDRVIAAGNGRSGSVNVCDAFTKFTLDIVGKTVLGQDLSNLKPITFTGEEHQDVKNESYRFYEAYESIFSQGPVGNALLFANGFVPIRWLPLKANRDFLYGTSWLNDVLRGLIRKRTAEITARNKSAKPNTIESRDLLTFIVEESMPGGPAEGIAEENFLGHLLQFMAAGVDTSSNMLAWSALVFATQQDVQDTLRAEILELLAKSPHPSFAEIEKLTYLNWFIKESLRVYPPATTIHRQAVTDLVIDGVAVCKGTPIDVVFSTAMLNPLVWGDDADKVDPSRWGRLTEAQQSPHAFSAFSNGPRICVGRHFAMVEIKTILVEMISRYRFLRVEKPFVCENPSFTLKPTGLEISVERI